jgi:arylsulfatase A-like enzyme
MRTTLRRTAVRPVKSVLLATLLAVLGATVSVSVSASGSTAAGQIARRPNIVFVLADDLSTDLVRFLPHVRTMQQRGVNLRNYFVVDSLCCPSRTAILTGLYPHNNGVFTNSGSDGGYAAFNAHGNPAKTFGVSLQRAGYRTALLGKYLNGYQPSDGVPIGWDEWAVAGNGYREYDYAFNVNGSIRHRGHAPQDYLTDVLSRRASRFIRSNAAAGRPFAVEIAPFSPHQPAVPAPRDVRRYPHLRALRGPAWNTVPTHAPSWLARKPALSRDLERKITRLYRHRVRAALSIDRMIGHLYRVLEDAGVADNTYVVFSSDNGFHTGQYRLGPGKQTAFDTDIRVPLIVTGPGVPAGRSVATLAASIDLAPTFERIAHARAPIRRDGAALLPIWHGRAAPAGWRGGVLIEHHGRTPRGDPDAQPANSGIPPTYEAIRTLSSLYVEYSNGEREYYDLRVDPYQLHNRAGWAPVSVLRPLRVALHALERCRGRRGCT